MRVCASPAPARGPGAQSPLLVRSRYHLSKALNKVAERPSVDDLGVSKVRICTGVMHSPLSVSRGCGHGSARLHPFVESVTPSNLRAS